MKVLAALLVWSFAVPIVAADDVQYITPRIPSEKEKVEALQLGFILNGFSMVRHPTYGSIDVSTGFTNPLLSPPQGVVRTIPIDPKKKGK